LAHNKTLAAQLYHEFKGFFPKTPSNISSATTIFTSRKAYVPFRRHLHRQGSHHHDELDKLRMSATRSCRKARRDHRASVSCNLRHRSPEAYYGMLVTLEKGQQISREGALRRLVDIQYERSEDLRRGTFRVRGDMIEIYPPYQDEGFRLEMWGEQIDSIRQIDPLDRRS